MTAYVLGFEEVDRTQTALVGGKGAHLAELSHLDGVRVPDGFCVTTSAYQQVVAQAPLSDLIERLSRLGALDRAAVAPLRAEIQKTVSEVAVPSDVRTAIAEALARFGGPSPYAVRSSATAEDSPTASFAGQQDTYLNVVGLDAVLEHVRRCWASLFNERAVAYRLQNGFDHRQVFMAVVVQRMVFPDAAGVLFTADPVTGHRKIVAIEAVFGLGEAVVSGRVDADAYQVRDGRIVKKTIRTQRVIAKAAPRGGTEEQRLEPERGGRATLSDADVVRLAQLGRRIEAHFGRPQDIEWCRVGHDFHIVQSRPITTLYPIPIADGKQGKRVYLSVGHQQMMTDAMKPLGISLWQLTAARPMYEAGGRLFVDVTRALATEAGRAGLLNLAGKSDPLTGSALETLIERGDFVPSLPAAGTDLNPAGLAPAPIETDPALVSELVARNQASLEALKRNIRPKSGADLIEFILADVQELKRILFDPRSHRVIMAAIEATWWLNEQLQAWLGEKNAADVLTRSAPNNVTSQMGLSLLDVADVIRPHPALVTFLEQVVDDRFVDELPRLSGGRAARDAILAWLDRYGMRCVGEIDITRPRFGEVPATLVPLILGNVRNFEPGAARRRFERGMQVASEKKQELLRRLRALPDGERKAEETRQRIERVRTFIGYREYPKYGMVSRYFVYRQALLEEARRLVQAQVLRDAEDIYYLTFPELHEVARTRRVDHQLIRERRDAFRLHRALTPPRVLTSDGESIAGAYRRDAAPAGVLLGIPVCAGVVEGRARVIRDMAGADLVAGDILVTPYTDPSFTPLFVAIEGLVTEVGGLMSHGAVIAREYGLPAVVGVEQATQKIRDGQRIRVHGTDGYVEILPA